MLLPVPVFVVCWLTRREFYTLRSSVATYVLALNKSIRGSHRSLWSRWHETGCRTRMDLGLSRVKEGSVENYLCKVGCDFGQTYQVTAGCWLFLRFQCSCYTPNRLSPSPVMLGPNWRPLKALQTVRNVKMYKMQSNMKKWHHKTAPFIYLMLS